MKPSILIFSQAMELGGVERSLLGLLDSIDYDRYDVDLFLMRHSGELMPYLNPKAKLLPEIPQYASLAVPMASLVKSGQLGVLRGRLKGKLAARRFDKQHSSDKPSIAALTYSHKYTLNSMPPISGKTYDLAISFLTPHYFAREQVRAKKYAAWIHTDYTALTFDRSAELAMWEGYDAICGVSERASESFQSVFPELAQKVRTVENILPRELTCRQATMPQTDMPVGNGMSLLSVGRFCEAKNFDNVPDICRRLVADGLDVKWYLIGYGGDEPLIRQKIDKAGMQDRVIILGKKDNPYPYMRVCDLYVQPSRYEGKAVTVREAQLLGKPVVITDYATSGSQLENGVDGVIVPMDNADCAAGIAALLRDPARMQQLSENCAKRDYTNSAEVEKIYALMEDCPMIPKIIHYCWFGRGEKPELAKKCIASWKKFCPDFEIREWNEDNCDYLAMPFMAEAYAAKKYAFVSDVMRLAVLEQYGGVYFDTDVEVLRDISPLLDDEGFIGFENDQYVASGLTIAAEAHHPVIQAMIEEYKKLHFAGADGSVTPVGCPHLNTDVMERFGLVRNGQEQLVAGIHVYPADYFNPLDSVTGKLTKTENTYSIHWYSMSWLPKRKRIRAQLLRYLRRLCYAKKG